VFYNQQCIRVDGNFAEAYGNLANALKELGDIHAAVQFYVKVSPSRNSNFLLIIIDLLVLILFRP
jgi:hypothetical protein